MKRTVVLATISIAITAVLFLTASRPQGHENPFLIMKVVEGNRLVGGSHIYVVDEVGKVEHTELDVIRGGDNGSNLSQINYELNKLNERGYDLKHTSMTTDDVGTNIQVYHFQKR